MVSSEWIQNLSTFASNIIATTIVYPLDTIRLKKQLHLPIDYKINPLYKGYYAGILRQICYSSPNLIIYRNFTKKYHDTYQMVPSVTHKIMFSGFSGGVAGAIGNPSELLLVRSIQDTSGKNIVQLGKQIYQQHGFKAFTTGMVPMTLRCSVYNMGRLPIYSETKEWIQTNYPHYKGTVVSHGVSASLGSVMGIVISNPLDVVKSRMQSQQNTMSLYELSTSMLRKDGIKGFYSGFYPGLIKSAPHSILSFVFAEQMTLFFTGRELF
jgi:hypothetical protein